MYYLEMKRQSETTRVIKKSQPLVAIDVNLTTIDIIPAKAGIYIT